METNELLDRIKDRDTDAYLQLTQAYGWKLYSHLRSQFEDRETADAAFNETLTNFYNSLAGGDGEDAVEALLYAYADQTCRKMNGGAQSAQEIPAKPPVEPVSTVTEKPTVVEPEEKKAPERSGSFGFTLGVTILVIGILAALWVIIGLMMDMGILPELDLGYSWFNANLAPWF